MNSINLSWPISVLDESLLKRRLVLIAYPYSCLTVTHWKLLYGFVFTLVFVTCILKYSNQKAKTNVCRKILHVLLCGYIWQLLSMISRLIPLTFFESIPTTEKLDFMLKCALLTFYIAFSRKQKQKLFKMLKQCI